MNSSRLPNYGYARFAPVMVCTYTMFGPFFNNITRVRPAFNLL